MNELDIELLKLFRQLSPKDQDLILGVQAAMIASHEKPEDAEDN